MKRQGFASGNAAPVHGGHHSKERRKAYFHGKYHREVATTLLLVAFVVMCLYRLSG